MYITFLSMFLAYTCAALNSLGAFTIPDRVPPSWATGPISATLAIWRERFETRADEVAELGFDATFRRMWRFYLAWSEAGFRSGYLDVHQMLMEKAR